MSTPTPINNRQRSSSSGAEIMLLALLFMVALFGVALRLVELGML